MAAIAALGVCGAVPAHAARDCGRIGDASAPHAITAAGVSCPAARRLAKAHWLVSGRFDACALRKPCTVRGWRCSPSRRSSHVVIRCHRDGDRVRFTYAV